MPRFNLTEPVTWTSYLQYTITPTDAPSRLGSRPWHWAHRPAYNLAGNMRHSRRRTSMVLGPAQRPSDYTPTASVVASASAQGGNTRRAYLTGLDRAMLGFLLLLLACNVGAALLAAGWVTALATELLGAAYLLALAVRPAWRPLLTCLILLGAAAGFCELFTDYTGEHVVRSLIYPAGAPMLWDSPIYMPLSWTLWLTRLGYFPGRVL